jgi:hypothetical protein
MQPHSSMPWNRRTKSECSLKPCKSTFPLTKRLRRFAPSLVLTRCDGIKARSRTTEWWGAHRLSAWDLVVRWRWRMPWCVDFSAIVFCAATSVRHHLLPLLIVSSERLCEGTLVNCRNLLLIGFLPAPVLRLDSLHLFLHLRATLFW